MKTIPFTIIKKNWRKSSDYCFRYQELANEFDLIKKTIYKNISRKNSALPVRQDQDKVVVGVEGSLMKPIV